MECVNAVSIDTQTTSTTTVSASTSSSSTTTTNSTTDQQPPRSDRVFRPSIPPLTTTTATSISSHNSPVPSSPPLPARSPLRPPARSISIQSTSTTTSIISPLDSSDSGSITVTSSNTSPSTVASSSSSRTSTTSALTLDSPETSLTPEKDSPSPPEEFFLSPKPQPQMMRDRHNSFLSLNGLIDQVREEFGIDEEEANGTPPLRVKTGYRDIGVDEKMPRPQMHRPDSPLSGIDLEEELTPSVESEHLETQQPSNEQPEAPEAEKQEKLMSKRHHALHELLSSERAYASDLALIREVHIPLALGQTVPPHSVPLTPPTSVSGSSSSSSSNNSSRAVSTASSDSLMAGQTPMTAEDAKIIFSNVAELAMFADMLTEELEIALGHVVDGGQGEDSVGQLFLRIIPELERPYKHYITRHPTALQHLQNLPQTPALAAYLTYTQSVASSVSHAWDLASLLIKPVQRLLKYPLLLNAILEETPDTHPDKDNLRNARTRVEEIARNVNEGRRRAEVVKDVLTSKTPKKPSAPVGVAASVNLSKVKSLRHGGVTAANMRVSQLTEGGNSEAAQVEAMQNELKRLEVFAQQFAKNVVDWGKMMSNVMLALRTWALSFGKVIGLSSDQGSEAFDAFLGVVSTGLMPLTADLDAAINERLLKDMAHLLMTMNQPLKLLASMNEQEPYHYHLLTMPVSQKNRPPASLLAASTNYLALRGQLAAELPTYLTLMHRGFAIFVRRLASIQTHFWRDVKERWAELWEMLRVEGELNAGWEETCAVWCARWSDVDEVVKALGIMQPVPLSQQPSQAQIQAQLASIHAQNSTTSLPKGYATLQQQHQQHLEKERNMGQYFAYPEFYMPVTPNFSSQLAKERDRQQEKEQKVREKLERKSSKTHEEKPNIATINSMFAALEPSHSPALKKQAPANGATTMSLLSSLVPTTGNGSTFAPSTYTSGNGSVYSVSGPMPLGSMQSSSHGRDARRDRGRGTSDASTASAWTGNSGRHTNSSESVNGHGSSALVRRPSSQDSTRSRQQRPDAKSPSSSTRRRTHGYGLADEFEEYMQVHGTSLPPPYEGGQSLYSPNGGKDAATHTSHSKHSISRMKSMPLHGSVNSDKASMMTTSTSRTVGPSQAPLANGGGYVVGGDRVYYQPQVKESWEEYQYPESSVQTPSRSRDKERGRDHARHSNSKNHIAAAAAVPAATASPKTKSKERPTHARKRSGSVKSITSFFSGSSDRDRSSTAPPPDPQPLTPSQRDSWVSKPAKYICQVIHPCRPPALVQYYSFPFFTLQEGDLYEVLQEAGHPSIHPKLPLYVDDGEDCLLLCRDGKGMVGWALASFLEPISIDG